MDVLIDSLSSKYFTLNVDFEKIFLLNVKQFQYKDVNVEIKVLSSNECNTISIRRTVFYIKSFIDHLENVENKNLRKNLNIVLFPTNYEKILPNDNFVTSKDINNGLTSYSPLYIFIYRYEDIYKVIVHELIHYFNIDIQNKDCCIIKPNDIFYSQYFVNSINLNEAYTEALAICLYVKFTSLYFQCNSDLLFKKHKTRSIKIMNRYIQYVTKYKYVIENTNGYAYMICRAILLDKLDNFMNIVYLKNNNKINDEVVVSEIIKLLQDENNNKLLENSQGISLKAVYS